ASAPGEIAIVLVAFARTGSMPAHTSAGKEMSEPPPATEFTTPASTAAAKRTAASQRLTRSAAAWTRRSSSASELPDRQGDALGQGAEHDPHALPDRDVLGAAAHHVADEPRPLVELDDQHRQRQERAERGQERLVPDDVGVDRPGAARAHPVETPALPVCGLRRPVIGAGLAIALHEEPALATAVPE